MKNLFLSAFVLLSFSAFAQFYPPDSIPFCAYDFEVYTCVNGAPSNQWVYKVEICSIPNSSWDKSHEEKLQEIQDYFCDFGVLPPGTKITETRKIFF